MNIHNFSSSPLWPLLPYSKGFFFFFSSYPCSSLCSEYSTSTQPIHRRNLKASLSLWCMPLPIHVVFIHHITISICPPWANRLQAGKQILLIVNIIAQVQQTVIVMTIKVPQVHHPLERLHWLLSKYHQHRQSNNLMAILATAASCKTCTSLVLYY